MGKRKECGRDAIASLMPMRRKAVVVIPGVCLVLLVLHLVFPKLAVDSVSLALVALGLSPFLLYFVKSLKLPGGMEVVLQDLLDLTQDAKQVGLLSNRVGNQSDYEYSFLSVADTDPMLALVGLRIEIERQIREIARDNDVISERIGLRQMVSELVNRRVLDARQMSVLLDILGILNNAAHGASVESDAAKWALDIGPRLINGLRRLRGEAMHRQDRDADS